MRRLVQQAEAVVRARRGYSVECILHRQVTEVLRFAKSQIHQPIDEETSTAVFLVRRGGRESVVTGEVVGVRSLRALLEKALSLLEFAPSEDHLPPLRGPARYARVRHDERLFTVGPESITPPITQAFREAERHGFLVSGAVRRTAQQVALVNSRGLRALAELSQASVTAVTHADAISGFAEAAAPFWRELPLEETFQGSLRRAAAARDPEPREPGSYTAFLEPYAVAEILTMMAFAGFNGKRFAEGQSFLNDYLDRPTFSPSFTLVDDPLHPETPGLPFDFEGTPRQRTVLVEAGIPRVVPVDRKLARQLGRRSTGHALPPPRTWGAVPFHLHLLPGRTPLRELAQDLRNALWITRFHYVNIVQPRRLLLTGMTRDGTWWHDGTARRPVQNLRFTGSFLEVFRRIRAVTRETKRLPFGTGYLRVPGLLVEGLEFTSKSRI